jgi:CelD/BcsL family acetyltransferase involved in cellulose biosynthesis
MPNALCFAISFKNIDYSFDIAIPTHFQYHFFKTNLKKKKKRKKKKRKEKKAAPNFLLSNVCIMRQFYE